MGGKGAVGSQTSLPCSGSSAGTGAQCSCSLAGSGLGVMSNARGSVQDLAMLSFLALCAVQAAESLKQ